MPANPWSWNRRLVLVVAALALVAVGLIVLITESANRAQAGVPTLSSTYAALTNTEPTGLPRVSDAARANELSTKGPVIGTATPPPASATDPSAPLPPTIRRLPIPLASASAWIAESNNGGVCLLVSPHKPIKGHYPIGMSCGSSLTVTEGTYGELNEAGSAASTIVGVEPNGVTSVTVKLSNGTTKTLPVSDNAWALEANASVQSATQTIGG